MSGKIRDVSAYVLSSGDAIPTPTTYEVKLRKVTGYLVATAPPVKTLTLRRINAYGVATPIVRTLSVRKVTAYAIAKVPERTLTFRKITGYAIATVPTRTLTLRKMTGYLAISPIVRTLSMRSVTGYLVAGPAIIRTLSLRRATAYAVVSIASKVSVREMNGFALIRPTFFPPFHMTSHKGILWAINKQHNLRLTEGEVVFGVPTVLDNDQHYNTLLALTASETSGYLGSKNLRYNRCTLSAAFFRKDITALKSFGTTIAGSLAAINEKYALSLTADDIVDGPVAAGATTLTLTTSANSYYYLPGQTVTLGA